MPQQVFKKINREATLSSKVEEQIREAIRQNVFVPGDKLPGEIQLAERFGVSRTAIREALRMLAGRGMVEIRKGSGIYVSEFDVENVVDPFFHLLQLKCGDTSMIHLIHVRLFIEPELAKLAALNYDDNDVKNLKISLDNMFKCKDNMQKMIIHDIKFHRQIASATENPILPLIMEPIYELMYRFISNTYQQSQASELALHYHSEIYQAIVDNDGEKAFENMKAHLQIAEDHAKKREEAESS